jgi:hypothetical protein
MIASRFAFGLLATNWEPFKEVRWEGDRWFLVDLRDSWWSNIILLEYLKVRLIG